MRAGPLSDARVIELLNAHFVPVYISNEDYAGKTPAVPVDEVKAHQRIYHDALKEKRSAGSVCVYLVDGDSKGLASMIVSTAATKDNLAKLLEATVERLKVPAGKPLITPVPQAPPPTVAATDVLLHLVARVDNRGSWGEFPAENWIVLSKDQAKRWLPAVTQAGKTWTIAREDAIPVLTYFFPQTEVCDFARMTDPLGPYKHRFEALELRGMVLSVDGNKVRARLDGSLKLKHNFYPGRDDNNYAEATVLGYLDFDCESGKIQTLRLATQQANYGRSKYQATARSVAGK